MIGRASRQLPPQMPAPPSYQKVNPADQPIIFLVLRSNTLPLSTIDEYAQTTDRAAHLDGQRRGAGQRVRARRSMPCGSTSTRASWRRAAIGIDEVATAIQNANVNLPTGTIYGPSARSSCRPTAS